MTKTWGTAGRAVSVGEVATGLASDDGGGVEDEDEDEDGGGAGGEEDEEREPSHDSSKMITRGIGGAWHRPRNAS